MAKEKRKPKTEGNLGINIGGSGLGNLVDGILGNLGNLGDLGDLGNLEELLNTADRLADAKGDSEAKEKVRRVREALGETGAVKEDIKADGLGGLFSQILNFVEKTGSQEGTQEFEIGGKKGVVSRGIRIGGLGGPEGKSSSEEFDVRRHEHKVPKTDKKPVVEEKVPEPALDVFEEGDCIKVIGDMPGVSEGDIKYEIESNVLKIWTEGHRKYRKELPLPISVDAEKVELSYKNGVLEVTLTKRK